MGAPHPEFGAALRQLVEDRRLSYRELSRRAHFSTGYISDLINGRKPANADVAKRWTRRSTPADA